MANGDKKGGLVTVRDTVISSDSTKEVATITLSTRSAVRLEVVFVCQRTNSNAMTTFTSVSSINTTDTTATIQSGPTDVNVQGADVTSSVTASGLDVTISAVVGAGSPWRVATWVYLYEVGQAYIVI